MRHNFSPTRSVIRLIIYAAQFPPTTSVNDLSLALWMTNGIDAALQTLWPPALGLPFQQRPSWFFVGHHPRCVFLPFTWHHHTWPNLPGLPPPYFAYCKHSMTGGGNSLGIRPCKSMAHFLGSGLRMTWTRHTCNYCRRMLNVSRCIISIWCQNCSAWSQFLNRAKWQFGWCEQFCPLDRINLLISGESDFHSFLFNYRREPQQWQ